ncbi:xylose repressor [Cohnella abietis]|uniref:Xylose repressor n=2 Tax=Cohnella abietis TaxID=2507935 RepID=A0A3T1D2B9_9BACL|nr:xylose repressor [Cohnella abietis]
MAGNNTKILKKANTYLVLNSIISAESITIEDVAKKTKLSRPTIVNIVKELTERDIIFKSGYAEYTGGRLPTLLSLNANAYYTIGIDFEFPPIRMVISNLKGEVIEKRGISVDKNATRNEIIQAMFEELDDLIASSGIAKEKFIGIGIGLLGYLKANEGISIEILRILDWKDVDFKSLVKERYNLPVYMQNDIHMMALAEKRLFLPQIEGDFAYIGIRPGIRSGIGLAMYINGSFYGGTNGNAHLLGHMTIDLNGAPCFCGSKGCLESIAGEPNLVMRYKRLLGEDLDNVDIHSIRDIYARALDGEATAKDVLDEAGSSLGIGIANVVKLFGLTTVVIGGPDSELYTSIIRDHLKKNIFKYMANDLEIIVGQLQEDLFPLGSCFLVIDQFFKEPRLYL